jgi:membrane associated rhomboid family serine protease
LCPVPGVSHFLLLVLLLFGAVVYFMTPAERTRLYEASLAALHNLKDAAALEGLQSDPFFAALRARSPRAVVTPLIIVLSTIVFLRSPVLALLVNAVCLWQIGVILERLVGRVAFAVVYVASGVAASIVSLSLSPDSMSAGPLGPVTGMYGLLLVTSIWSAVHRSSVTIPIHLAKKLAQIAAIFVLYKLMTTGVWDGATLAAFVCGVAGGIVVARDASEGTSQTGRLATAMAMVLTVVTLYGLMAVHGPSNQTVDVRSEIDRVLAAENRTAGVYDKEVDRFRTGRITAAALVDVIEKAIVPELHDVQKRLGALRDVPPEQKPLITSAETFLTLREESWRLRAAALHKSDMPGLRQADTKERASREAFVRLSNLARG